MKTLEPVPYANTIGRYSFSFTRNRRFRPDYTHKSMDLTYDLPSTITKKTCTFGFGNKVSIANKTFSPSPNKYKIISNFESLQKKKFSFGRGRDQSTFGAVYPNPRGNLLIPGPGQYKAQSSLAQNKIYMGIKLECQIFKPKNNFPGPGAYQLSPENLNKNTQSITKVLTPELPVKQRRFRTQYNQQQPINQQSRTYKQFSIKKYLPRFKGRQNKLLIIQKHKKQRINYTTAKDPFTGIQKNKETPGPGQYQVISCFTKSNKHILSTKEKNQQSPQ